MNENPDFRRDPNLSFRLSRRQFLKLAATTAGGVMLQTACAPIERINALTLGCSDSPRLEIPSSYVNDLEEIIAPLTKLMPSTTAENLTIKVGKPVINPMDVLFVKTKRLESFCPMPHQNIWRMAKKSHSMKQFTCSIRAITPHLITLKKKLKKERDAINTLLMNT